MNYMYKTAAQELNDAYLAGVYAANMWLQKEAAAKTRGLDVVRNAKDMLAKIKNNPMGSGQYNFTEAKIRETASNLAAKARTKEDFDLVEQLLKSIPQN